METNQSLLLVLILLIIENVSIILYPFKFNLLNHHISKITNNVVYSRLSK